MASRAADPPMLHAASLIAVAACLVPLSASAATPLSFDGAQLGMTLSEWRSLAPPEGAGPDALPTCSDDPRIAMLAHNPFSVSLRTSGVVTCTYMDLFGHTALPHSVELDAAHRANDLQYRFDRGRLVEIRFSASIDAFSDVMAMLERQYGRPTATARDKVRTPEGRFARVTQTWRASRGAITVVDPSDELTQLEVSLTGPTGDAATPAIAAATLSRGQ